MTKSLLALANTEADANSKRVADLRAKIAPLMENLKTLTPAQREKVTELLYNADELEAKNEAMLTEMARRCDAMKAKARAEIFVSEIIYAGVKIRLPGAERSIATPLQGPLKLSVRDVDNSPTIVVTYGSSGVEHFLPSDLIISISPATPMPLKSAA